MPCTLSNLVAILRVALTTLEQIENQNLVIAYGNTGCGKSTIFSSLVYGSDALTLRNIEVETRVPVDDQGNVKSVMKKHKVIDHKDGKDFFEIGHSQHSSKTFFPHFLKDQATGLVYADIAGLKDTDGDLIELVNFFINKSIFKKARSLKFLVPITIG